MLRMASEEWLLPNPAQSSRLVGSRVAVLLTQPVGEPELLAAFRAAVRGAAGGLLAQAPASRITARVRSGVFNMAAAFRLRVIVGSNALAAQRCTGFSACSEATGTGRMRGSQKGTQDK